MKIILNDHIYKDKEIYSKRPPMPHNLKVPKTHVIPPKMSPSALPYTRNMSLFLFLLLNVCIFRGCLYKGNTLSRMYSSLSF